MCGSFVHIKWLQLQRQRHPDECPIELKSFSDTRWASQIAACDAVFKRLDCVLELIQMVAEDGNRDRDRICEAVALKVLINFTFVYNLLLFTNILQQMKNVCDQLQSKTLQLTSAFDLIDMVIKGLNNMRNDNECHKLMCHAKDICAKHDIPINVGAWNKRRKKVPSHIAESIVTENVGLSDDQYVNEEDYLKNTIFYPSIDKAVVEIRNRFSDTNMEILSAINSFVPHNTGFLEFNKIKAFAEHYKANIQDLEIELTQLNRLIERKKASNQFCADNLLDMLKFVCVYEDAFHETKRLLQIACSIPVTSAEAERTFSCLKLIKTYLRTTMTDVRLSNIAIISIHKQRAHQLDLDRVIDFFIQMYPNCRISLK